MHAKKISAHVKKGHVHEKRDHVHGEKSRNCEERIHVQTKKDLASPPTDRVSEDGLHKHAILERECAKETAVRSTGETNDAGNGQKFRTVAREGAPTHLVSGSARGTDASRGNAGAKAAAPDAASARYGTPVRALVSMSMTLE